MTHTMYRSRQNNKKKNNVNNQNAFTLNKIRKENP